MASSSSDDDKRKRVKRQRTSPDDSDSRKRKKKRKREKEKKRKKKRYRRTSDSISSGSSSDDGSYRRRHKASKERQRKRESKQRKGKMGSYASITGENSAAKLREEQSILLAPEDVIVEPAKLATAANPPAEATQIRNTALIPMTREQYEAQRKQVREVYDEQSGRYRLVRGDGEIIERIVSRGAHEEINQNATRGDGASFSKSIVAAIRR